MFFPGWIRHAIVTVLVFEAALHVFSIEWAWWQRFVFVWIPASLAAQWLTDTRPPDEATEMRASEAYEQRFGQLPR